MKNEVKKVPAPGRAEVEVLGATFEEGIPQGVEAGHWRQKMENRSEKLKYLQTGERYFYSQDWFGSEKRKKPA